MPGVGCRFMTGGAGGHRGRDRPVAGDTQCWGRDAGVAELEAAGIHIRRRMAARTVAVEAADRDVIGRLADGRDVGERQRSAVTAEAGRHALVRAGDRIDRVVARPWYGTACTLRWSGMWFAGFADCVISVANVGVRGMAAIAVAAGRMRLVERCRARVSGRGGAARQHADVRCALVTGLAAADGGGDGGVAGHVQGRSGNAGSADLEAAGIDVLGGVTARAVAVERADRDVIGRRADHRDVEERSDGRAVTAQAGRHALMRAA